jgi:glutathione synthase/RimK-type ligase-like ATP-grasp enzyme
MILIISISTDTSTNLVCHYLNQNKNVNFLRINLEDLFFLKSIKFNKDNDPAIEIIHKNALINLNDIDIIWYRNGHFFQEFINKISTINKPLSEELINFHIEEIEVLNTFIFNCLEKKRIIGSFTYGTINKLQILDIANHIGLKIPQTIITTEFSEAQNFLSKHVNVIIKPLKESKRVKTKEFTFLPYTRKIDFLKTQKFNTSFFPILLQEYIEPFCEIRVFIIKQKLFCMAILTSIKKSDCSTDWRMTDNLGLNRYVPFSMPVKMKNLILKLMKTINLNTGSIDLILTKKNEFYFLEINPTGQFHFLSHYCNYQIEKQISKTLIHETDFNGLNKFSKNQKHKEKG